MSLVKLVIFDLDGTLFDSLEDLASATNHMLTVCGRPVITSSDVRLLVGQGARSLVERALCGASADDIDTGLRHFLDYNEAHIADQTRLYPGVRETLSHLAAQQLPMAVVSNKNVALCRRLLDLFGIGIFFTAVLGADSLPQRKPSPEPILKLVRDFNVPPGEVMIIGDSCNDIQAGKGAGVITVGCTYGYGELVELADADFRIDGMPELLNLPSFA
jgi:phosphoglycolate phosphatase